MKIILFLSVVNAVFAVEEVPTTEPEKTIVKMPPEVADEIKKYAVPCADENSLDHSVIAKLPSGSVPDHEAGKKFVYCVTRAMGYVTEDGHIITEKLAELLKGHPLQEKFREALDQCNKETKENPLATVMAMHKCFGERPPVRIVL